MIERGKGVDPCESSILPFPCLVRPLGVSPPGSMIRGNQEKRFLQVLPFPSKRNTHRSSSIDIQVTLALPIPTIETRPVRPHGIQRRRWRTTGRGSSHSGVNNVRCAANLSMLAHGVGILWSHRVHQRGHVWHARDLADGRQHVLRWA
jgi:hypothetical protein